MIHKKLIRYMGGEIRDEFRRLNSDLRANNRISKCDLDNISKLVESFVLASDESQYLTEDASKYMSEYNSLCRKLEMNESRRGGFFNPFDDYEPAVKKVVTPEDASDDASIKIKKISMWRSSENGNSVYNENGVFANRSFFKGNIIEICKVHKVDEADLYAKVVRDAAFLLDEKTRTYGIPSGQAVEYRNSLESGLDANADYEYDADSNTIKIYALKRILKGDELILASDETSFENEIKPNQFKYSQGPEPYFEIKDFKIV